VEAVISLAKTLSLKIEYFKGDKEKGYLPFLAANLITA
jgi:hypothetical protein